MTTPTLRSKRTGARHPHRLSHTRKQDRFFVDGSLRTLMLLLLLITLLMAWYVFTQNS